MPDSHVYLLIGKWITAALLPYRDAFEVKPPGTFYYVAALFSVLPTALWSRRFADFFEPSVSSRVRVCNLSAQPASCRRNESRRRHQFLRCVGSGPVPFELGSPALP